MWFLAISRKFWITKIWSYTVVYCIWQWRLVMCMLMVSIVLQWCQSILESLCDIISMKVTIKWLMSYVLKVKNKYWIHFTSPIICFFFDGQGLTESYDIGSWKCPQINVALMGPSVKTWDILASKWKWKISLDYIHTNVDRYQLKWWL